MTEHEYTDTYYYKKEEREGQNKQKQDGMKKSLYMIVSVLVAVIGSICFLLAALLYLVSNIFGMIQNIFSKKRLSKKDRVGRRGDKS